MRVINRSLGIKVLSKLRIFTVCAVFWVAPMLGQPLILPGPTGPFVVPMPASRDCKEHESCRLLNEGYEGTCEQIYCGVGHKCFRCVPNHRPRAV